MNLNCIRYHTEGALAWITLNRPEKLNSIDAAMVAELNKVLDSAEANEQVRVIVLRGEGRAFSAGFDLEDSCEPDDEQGLREELNRDFGIIMRFWDSPKVTLAMVHGHCLGSAMEMALACDITIAADDCRLGAPEVKFGSGIVALVMPWLCGPKKAKEWLLTGNDRISAQDAQAWGLINMVVTHDRLEQASREMAMEIATNDPVAVCLTKRAINRSSEISGMKTALAEALEVDIEVELTETDESREFNRILRTQGARAAIAWRRTHIG